MQHSASPPPYPTPRRVLAECRGPLLAVAVFSVAANLLLLTGPLFMLQVYDRVLVTRSVETLVALTLLMAVLYLGFGVIDHARGRILARIGARLVARLDGPALSAAMDRRGAQAAPPQTDLDAVQRLSGAPVMGALCDLPWTPFFLFGIFLLHPLLGGFAALGGAVLILVGLATQAATHQAGARGEGHAGAAHSLARMLQTETGLLRATGLLPGVRRLWQAERQAMSDDLALSGDRAALLYGAARTLRLFLQSALLALGAWLVLRDGLGAGAMIAAALMMGRALAPVDQAIGGWPLVARGIAGWRAVSALLSGAPPGPSPMALPPPVADLAAEALSVAHPGTSRTALRLVSFELPRGATLGVIGPNGSGKSTLARALAGEIAVSAGTIRLGGATLERYGPETLARHVGYLPQGRVLLPGTIAQNIARLAPRPDPAAVIAAARAAGAHELIQALPMGYDTPVGPQGEGLSGGQARRIALARAFFGSPCLLVLDEPDTGLDAVGEAALRDALSRHAAGGGSAVLFSHRPAVVRGCDLVLVLEDGTRRAFGPPGEVLPRHIAVAPLLTRQAGG